MKSKKLFAILTLVAFMMTLAPMAAFAAGETAYSAAASSVSPSSTSLSVYADTDDLAKITITFKGTDGKALAEDAEVDFWVKSDRDAELGYVDDNTATDTPLVGSGGVDTLADPSGQKIENAVVKDGGKVHLYVGSGISGSFKISIYNGDPDDDGLLIGSTNISVSVGDGLISLEAINEDTSTSYAEGDPVDDINAGEGVELTATVEDGGTAIEDVEVTFQAKYEGGSWYTIAKDVTDEDGEAKYYFEETKTGAYQYRAKTPDETSGVIMFNVKALTDSKTIELKTADGKKIAQKEDNNIDFYVKDKYGNLIKSFAANKYAVAFGSAPEGSKFEDVDWTTGGVNDADVSIAKMADGVLRVVFQPDKEGTYTLKVRDDAERRVTASIELEAIKFEEAVSMKLKVQNTKGEDVQVLTRVYETDAYNKDHNYKAGELIVTLVNEAGVELTTTNDLQFASSNIGKVDFPTKTDGDIVIKADAIGTYTLTAYYAEDNLTASYDLEVVGSPRAIVATPTVTGKTATVGLQYVDANGNNTWVVDAAGNVPDEGYQIVVPSGVTAKNVKDIKKTGTGSFELVADEYGKYNVTVITSNKGIAKTFEVEFVQPDSEKPVIGAKNVTMFIGAPGYTQDGAPKVTDVAPFIQDGRTFVAVRPVADAFGAEIGWNEATQTVTLTRSDMTVTIVIGSSAITVVEDGVTTTVTADVAAYIKDGRTVLPFRAVGEAFGATVDYDAATQAVTYVQ